LAILAASPVVVLSSWVTYKQAKKYDMKRERLMEDRRRLLSSFKSILVTKIAIRKKQLEISAFCDEFQTKTGPLLQLLQPPGFVNRIRRAMPWLFGAPQLPPEHLKARDQLAQHVHGFLKRLEANKFI
jgi:hypothetical protein